jgi:hypothetical protein
LYIPSKIGIGSLSAYAQQQQQNAVDPLTNSLQIAQSKVQSTTSPGAFGHGVPSLYNIPSQNLLMMLGITIAGCLTAYLIINIMLNRTKEKEKKVMYQQQ